MPAKSKAQQRFMGMVHAAQNGELDNPSSEVEKVADSMSDADAKDYASTKHKGLPNHVKKENMEKELKEIIRQTYRESLRESINEDAAELPQATIPSAVKVKLQMAIDKIKDSKLSNNAKLQLVAQVIDALDVDKSQLSTIANKIRSKMESVQMNEISSIDGLVDVVKGQTSHIEGIKLSKDMAGHIISWMNTSPYGRKYNSWVKKNSISKILPIAFNWGLDRGVQSNLKNEFAALKAKYGKKENESVNESIKYNNDGFVTQMINAAGKVVKDITLDGETFSLKGNKYISKKGGKDLHKSHFGINESVNETISHEAMGIASMTNTRKEAVQKFIDDNNLNAKEILNHVTKGKLPERIRFVQALVGTPNNSSFKWYVKTYANESVNESIDINHWKKYANGGGPLFSRKVKTQREFNTEFREVAYGYNNDPDSRENKLKRDKIEKVKKLAQEFFDKEGFITSNIIDEMWSAMVSGKIKEGKVNEGKKAFKINPPIGSSKYSISAYDGITKHKDGSPFWNILIFKNKADLERRANYFRSEKYIEEAVNESVIKEDVYKTILSNDKGKMFFGLVDDETRDVKFLDAVTWIKSTIKDKASDSSKELVLAALVRQINQFNRKVEYNMWVNANKPTWEEKIKHLLDKRLVNNVNRGGIKVH